VFGIPLSVEIIIRPSWAAAGTVVGPILGSFIRAPSPSWPVTTSLRAAGTRPPRRYGLLLIAVVLFLPEARTRGWRGCSGAGRRTRHELLETRGLSKHSAGVHAVPGSI